MTAYYVQPEPSAAGGEAYWLEGYAVGDAKFAAAQSDGTSTTLIASSRVKETGLRADGTSTSLFGGNRVVAGALVQEPVTATVTGVTRVRQGSIRADGASTTLMGVVRVRTSGAASQSLYVIDDYWVNGYADYGDGSSVRIAGNKTTNSGVLSAGSATTLIGVTRVKPSSMLAIAEAEVDAAGGAIRTNIGVLSDANGIFVINGNVTYASSAVSEAVSAALGALTIKWLDQAEDQDVWTDQTEDGDTWTNVVEASGTWTTVSEDGDIWTDVSEDTDTWVDKSPLT
jgi:hypothetical protein